MHPSVSNLKLCSSFNHLSVTMDILGHLNKRTFELHPSHPSNHKNLLLICQPFSEEQKRRTNKHIPNDLTSSYCDNGSKYMLRVCVKERARESDIPFSSFPQVKDRINLCMDLPKLLVTKC